MAAHSYDALQYLKDYHKPTWIKDLETGLKYAPWADELEFEDYYILNNLVEGYKNVLEVDDITAVEALEKIYLSVINAMIVKYHGVWEALGRPRSHEEWFERKYSKQTLS